MNTLDLLMAKAEQRNNDKLKVKKIESKAIGGEIILKKPPLSKVTQVLDDAEDLNGTMDNIRSNATIIYEAWPLVKENFAQLKEAYGVADPIDLIIAMFDDNIDELQIIAMEVLQFFGMGTEQIKN